MTTIHQRDGQAVWIVSAPVIGMTLEVEIDDVTGRILRVARVGLR